jgi:hypothetical protein
MRKLLAVLLLCLFVTGSAFAADTKLEEASLLQIFEVLKSKQFVDLTHAFTSGIPY